jgi:hypothetical protein
VRNVGNELDRTHGIKDCVAVGFGVEQPGYEITPTELRVPASTENDKARFYLQGTGQGRRGC